MRALEILFERNIVNVADIPPFVAQLVRRAHTPRVQQYLQSKLPAWLKRSYNGTEPVSYPELRGYFAVIPDWARQGVERGDLERVILNNDLAEEIAQVVDYLESDAATALNIARLPFEEAIQRSQAWHRQMASQTAKVAMQADDLREIRKYGNGYRWVQLMSSAALDEEGQKMQHCVGGGSYDQRLHSGVTQIYSLRDPQDEPHVTIEVTSKQLQQVKGKQNKPPVEKYRRAVLDFLNLEINRDLKVEDCHDLTAMNIFKGAKGFGPIEAVAADVKVLQSGHKLCALQGKPDDTVYLTDANAILGRLLLRQNVIEYLYISGDVRSKKALRGDFIEIMKSYEIAPMPSMHLRRYFGLLVGGPTGSASISSHPDSTEIARDDQFVAIMHDEASEAGKRASRDILFLDHSGHPVITLMLGIDGKSIVGVDEDEEWQSAIPLFLEVRKTQEIYHLGPMQRRLLEAGYVFHGGDWQPAKPLIEGATPLHESENGGWFLLSGTLYLYADDGLRAGIEVRHREDDDDYVAEGVVKEIKVDDKYKIDIANVVENFLQLSEDYDDDGFFLHYGIFVQENYQGLDVHVIDYQEEVIEHVVRINEAEDIVYDQRSPTTLFNAMDMLGVHGEYYMLQNHFFPALFGQGEYEEDREESDWSNPPEFYYGDPQEYREEHDLDPDEELPEITRTITTIER